MSAFFASSARISVSSYIVSVNTAFSGTSELTVWLLTVSAFPPLMLPEPTSRHLPKISSSEFALL